MQASRGPLSLLAGNRAKTPGALGYAASEVSPAARTPSSTSAKPEPGATNLHESQIVARSLLVASGDGSEAFESVKEDHNLPSELLP